VITLLVEKNSKQELSRNVPTTTAFEQGEIRSPRRLLAEREGFEPSVPLPVRQISNQEIRERVSAFVRQQMDLVLRWYLYGTYVRAFEPTLPNSNKIACH
jgi:hypothetical protein